MSVQIIVECDARGCCNSTEIQSDHDSSIENECWFIDYNEGMHYCPSCTPEIKKEMGVS